MGGDGAATGGGDDPRPRFAGLLDSPGELTEKRRDMAANFNDPNLTRLMIVDDDR